MKVNIPFKERFREPMIKGAKTWTSRTKPYGKPGDTFDVFGHTFEIVKTQRRILDDVAEHYNEEGCASREDFVELWKKIHPRKGFNPWQRVYVHIFRRISL